MVVLTTCSLLLCAGLWGCGEDDSNVTAPPGDTGALDVAKTDADSSPSDGQAEELSEPDTTGADTSETPWTQQVEDGDWTWISRHDGAIAGAHQYPKAPNDYYEYTRFEVFQPFELRALRVMARLVVDETFVLYVWDDLGGNFLHMEPTKPLATLQRDLTVADSDTWQEFTLDKPLRMDPGRIFYVGTIVNGEEGARIGMDAVLSPGSGDKPAWSLVWLSKDVEPSTGTYTVFSAAAGDLLVDVELRHIDVVQQDDFVFQGVPPELLGFQGASSYFDLEGDGDLDGATGKELWVNDGDNQFSLVAEGVMPEGGSGRGHWADFDNDGDQDLLLTGQEEFLFRNDGGLFVDITANSGIDDSQIHTCNGVTSEGHVPTETATWLDYDGDGLLDVYLGNFICWDDGFAAKDMLYRNLGDGTFENVSEGAGVMLWQGYGQAARSTSPADYDNDGDMDLLVNNYRLHRNLFWRNLGDGTFSDAAAQTTLAGTKQGSAYGHSISSTWADFDHDGFLDVFVANLAHPRFLEFSDKSRLYMNSGGADPVFEDVTAETGFRYQETAGGAIAWDYDNDGDMDLLWNCIYADRPSQFYRNEWPEGGWTEVTYPTGLRITNGWEVSIADLDDDGDLDYTANKYGTENDDNLFLNKNPWNRRSVQIRPLGRGLGGTNRDGFGARVRVMVEGVDRMQEKVPSSGISNQSSPWLHFGIGQADAADVTVEFPVSGESYSFLSLSAGRYTVDEDGNLTQER
jgi:hypothetical protein